MSHSRPAFVRLALVVIVAAALAACSAAPAAVSPTLESTQAPVAPAATEAPAASSTAAPTGAPAAASGTARTFVVVPDKTTASYSIDEVFINQNNKLNTAIGKTTQVKGQLVLDTANPAASQLGQFEVDISTLASDSSRRDSMIRGRWLESTTYPLATFVATAIRDFPANPQEGQPVSFKLDGNMTIHNTSQPVTWDVTATLNQDTLTGTATTSIMLVNFNVQPPDIAGMLKVTDGAKLTLDFTLQAQP